jgi:hypothetical protein
MRKSTDFQAEKHKVPLGAYGYKGMCQFGLSSRGEVKARTSTHVAHSMDPLQLPL